MYVDKSGNDVDPSGNGETNKVKKSGAGIVIVEDYRESEPVVPIAEDEDEQQPLSQNDRQDVEAQEEVKKQQDR